MLWKDEAVKFRFQLFVASIDKRILELEYHNFEDTDFQSFQHVMATEAARVLQDTPGFKSKPCKVTFLNTEMKVPIVSLNDEWSYRVHARARGVAFSMGTVPRMPWEEWNEYLYMKSRIHMYIYIYISNIQYISYGA